MNTTYSPSSDLASASESYNAHLEEIQELQLKLSHSTSMVEKISQERQQFQRRFEQSQVELEEARKKLRESKDALCSQVKMTCLREKELGILESKWKTKVEREREEIVKAREQLELFNIRENVEKEFDCRLEKLKEEVSSSFLLLYGVYILEQQ
jgi:chromosome segregation ATPase